MSEHSGRDCTDAKLGDLLAAYELGLLEGPDQARFEAHLGECPACLEELYQGAADAESLRAAPGRYANRLAGSLAARQRAPWRRLGDFLRTRLQPRVLVPVATVAAVALLLVLVPQDRLPSSAGLAVVEPLPYQGLQLRGATGEELDRLLSEGLEEYAADRYGRAAAALGSAWELAGEDPQWTDRHQAALFLGISLLLDGRPEEAVDPLGAAVESVLLPTAERGTWYLAQTHLLREDPRASLPLLESLLNSPVYGTRAADQLHSVRQICDNSDGS